MRILLIGDHALLLQGLARLLADEAAADVRTTRRIDEAADWVSAWKPDIAILETSDVTGAGPTLIRLRDAAPALPLLVIAPNEREQFLAALRAGVRGFIGRQMSVEELLGTINAVRRGEWGIPRALAGELAVEYLALLEERQPAHTLSLTPREQQVLSLLAQGMSAERIGRALYVSESTIRNEIRGLAGKFGVANRVQVVTEALRLGLVSREESCA